MPFQPPFTDVPSALEEFRAGRMLVVVDDEDRENEGDLTLAAEKATPEAINFMAREGRGLVCLAMSEERLDHLRLGPMSAENTSTFGTAFTESPRRDPATSPGPATYFRCARARAACWPAPGRPKQQSTSPAWPAWSRPASFVKS